MSQTQRLILASALFCCGSAIAAAEPPRHERVEPVKIVAFGDSTTALRPGLVKRVYADALAEELPRRKYLVKVINAGVPSNNTADARRRLEQDVLAKKPHLVVVQFGINDAAVDVWQEPPKKTSRVDLKDFERNLTEIIEAIHRQESEVILMTPNPTRWTPEVKRLYGKPPYDPQDPDGFNVLLKKYAETVREIAKREKVPLVDVYAIFQEYGRKPGQAVDDLLLDGIHPNDAGHKIVAEQLMKTIRESKRRD